VVETQVATRARHTVAACDVFLRCDAGYAAIMEELAQMIRNEGVLRMPNVLIPCRQSLQKISGIAELNLILS
jgi:hypothetical protein